MATLLFELSKKEIQSAIVPHGSIDRYPFFNEFFTYLHLYVKENYLIIESTNGHFLIRLTHHGLLNPLVEKEIDFYILIKDLKPLLKNKNICFFVADDDNLLCMDTNTTEIIQKLENQKSKATQPYPKVDMLFPDLTELHKRKSDNSIDASNFFAIDLHYLGEMRKSLSFLKNKKNVATFYFRENDRVIYAYHRGLNWESLVMPCNIQKHLQINYRLENSICFPVFLINRN